MLFRSANQKLEFLEFLPIVIGALRAPKELEVDARGIQ